jgi:hypothetical protein
VVQCALWLDGNFWQAACAKDNLVLAAFRLDTCIVIEHERFQGGIDHCALKCSFSHWLFASGALSFFIQQPATV